MKIQTVQGKMGDTCTVSSNLTENGIKKPAVREIMEYAESRMLSTLIVSGAKSPWDARAGDTTAVKTKIGRIPDGMGIGDNAMRYKVMGRIQSKAAVVSQVGSTGADGTFVLKMKDTTLYNGLMVKFYRDNFYARVMGNPVRTSGGWNYTFLNTTELFDSSLHLHPSGQSFAFGAYTSYSEGSLRGYSRDYFASEFINHMTIQRKSYGLTGDALSDVTWYTADQGKGWRYTKEIQHDLQFMMENEHAKWDGQSNMRDSLGALKSSSGEVDPDTGLEITRGDGVLPQIWGTNEAWGSGSDGRQTIDDIKDMMKALEKRSDTTGGSLFYCVTGTDGFYHLQNLLNDYRVQVMNGQMLDNGDGVVNHNFDTFKFAGNTVVAVRNVTWDDTEKWFETDANGNLVRSGMMLFMDAGKNNSNIEIIAKKGNGFDRSLIRAYIGGLPSDRPLHSVDAVSYELLKQDMIVVYKNSGCGIINVTAPL